MSQILEIDRVKARIRALTEKTVQNGCTDAEAFAAAEMVGKLLDRYMLTMSEVQVREETCIQAKVPMAGKRRGPIDGCVPAIGRFCHCIVWLDQGQTMTGPEGVPTKHYIYFGFDADVQMAVYLYKIIEQAITSETARFKQAHPHLKGTSLRLATRSFQHGLVKRLDDRLQDLHRDREESLRAGPGRGTALVLVKQTVVADAFRETKIRLRARSVTVIAIDRRAYAAGEVAGDGINLARPVTDQGPARLR
ncbi:DUF2786 domain-containing protein [Acidisoma cellulosilytica]|uniref:DUF2786 domain-containing protein n=1 Tax=Acidisoma cellulosilyticum TaxID=2802395 RepID=A0A964E5R5_9PROT|nr:DUF2786 domain-containing protein [Acidisoma cellulosilyticum]MCB8882707.1 DUF2786 domain-containing protein [Acidisoma cellulosilyticum]